jgi:hypothetical protein
MMGLMNLEEEKTCKCGRVYRLSGSRIIVRDSDELECVCGEVLKRWSGAVIWTKTLTKDVVAGENSPSTGGSS